MLGQTRPLAVLLFLLVGLSKVNSYSLLPGIKFSVRSVSRIQNGNRVGHTRQSNNERLSGFVPLKAHSPTVAAATGLVVSSICGTVADRTVLPNAGILATLLVGGVFSSVGLVPSSHVLYDLCWSIFLPGSLALLLLGSDEASQKLSTSYRSITAVCVPFVIGSLASFTGCLASFSICKVFPHVKWILSPKDAAMAGSCLCASYVGGSVNFFAAARIIRANPTLLSAMAAADLFTMAIYFAWLASAIKDEKLIERFAGRRDDRVVPESLTDDQPMREETFSPRTQGLGAVLVTLLAYIVTSSANSVERVLARVVPGTACAVIAVVCPFLRQRASSISNDRVGRIWRAMKSSATPLSAFCFQLFFASIGISANVGQALTFGPGCLLFSAVALMLHVSLLLFGSLIIQKIWRFATFEFKHILVASNALIGGPATAAAYAGQYKTGLTMAATFWGVVGYAIGTNVGVGTAQLFRSFM